MRLRVVLALVVLATTAAPALAQITSATISGTITDKTGGVLPGVDVVITKLETGLTRTIRRIHTIRSRSGHRPSLTSATAGQVTRTVNTARQVQLGIKILF